MTTAVRFLTVWSDEIPPAAWAVEALESIQPREGALYLSTTGRPRVRQFEELLNVADMLIADVSSGRPDVYYLCGMAHARRLPTLLLAAEGSAQHFNVSAFPVRRYSQSSQMVAAIQLALAEVAALNRALETEKLQRLEQRRAQRLEESRASSRPLPRYLRAQTVDSLRSMLGAQALAPELSGTSLGDAPNGSFGFTWGVSLPKVIERVLEGMSDVDPNQDPLQTMELRSTRGMSDVEVIKAMDGTVYLVGDAPEAAEFALASAATGSHVAITLYSDIHDDLLKFAGSSFWAKTRTRTEPATPMAVPLVRVRRVAQRLILEGSVLDLTVDCC
jgi:hypothetical protein